MSTSVNVGDDIFTLPYRGRFGYQIQRTLRNIIYNKTGIALYAAMNLKGNAQNYKGKYKRAFQRFADANPDKLKEGYPGPAGGYGYKYIPFQERWLLNSYHHIIPEGAD